MTEPAKFKSYGEFFTFYLGEHSNPVNRWLHAAGMILGILVAVLAFVTGHPKYALLWIPLAYGFAWTGHFLVEKNVPATFSHPWWSLVSDFRMLGLMLTGRLNSRGRTDVESQRQI
jgi:hypothetical protein